MQVVRFGMVYINNMQNAPSVKAYKYAYKKLNFKHIQKFTERPNIIYEQVYYFNVYDPFMLNLIYWYCIY